MLEKIISGGQTGADIAGLMAAKYHNITTGGYMPKGWITLGGPRPDYELTYGLKQHASASYAARTYANVQVSDGTLRIAFNFASSGELCTLKAIQKLKKPHLDVDLHNPRPIKDVIDWIEKYNIKTLNIAGNSEQTFAGSTGATLDYLCGLFSAMGFKVA